MYKIYKFRYTLTVFLPSTAVEFVAVQLAVPHKFPAVIVTVYTVFWFSGVVSVEVTLGPNTSL